MTIVGTAYGVALNDRAELAGLGDVLTQAPYGAPPRAPVVYIKPRNCLAAGGGVVRLPAGADVARIGSTLALIFSRQACRVSAAEALAAVGTVALAIDVSLPSADYYRPAIAEMCRDGFLPLGSPINFTGDPADTVIATTIDGIAAHEWRLDRLLRPAASLIAELSAFMTFEPGDLLLLGVAGDAPLASCGASVTVKADGFCPLSVHLKPETGQ